MSTSPCAATALPPIRPLQVLQPSIHGAEDERSPSLPQTLWERLTALDDLDVMIGNLDLVGCTTSEDLAHIARAKALRSALEAANDAVYRSLRAQIALHGDARGLHRLLMEPAGDELPRVRSGIGFDWRDELWSGVLQLREPGEVSLADSAEMVPYQPTPVRHILELVRASALSQQDVFVDLGSGMGHVPMLMSLLTGCRSIGIELEPAYVASAQQAAESLNLGRVRFVAEDARTAALSMGSVFYLFSPFTGSILADVLSRLQRCSATRQIKICSLGPCTRVLRELLWLEPMTDCDTERMAVFQSR